MANEPGKSTLVEFKLNHLLDRVDPSRIAHWTREASKLGAKPDEVRRSLPLLERIHQIREADLARQAEISLELMANSDVVIVVATPGIFPASQVLAAVSRQAWLKRSAQVIFEPIYPDLRWNGNLLQFLLRKGQRVAAVFLQRKADLQGSGAAELWNQTVSQYLEVMEVRHGAEEAKRRLLFVSDDPKLVGNSNRNFLLPESKLSDGDLFGAVGSLCGFLCGMDSNQFVEGARSFVRQFEKAAPAGEENCAKLAGHRVHLLTEKEQDECYLAQDPGASALLEWYRSTQERLMESLGLPQPRVLNALSLSAAPLAAHQYGLSINWSEDDSPGEFSGLSILHPKLACLEAGVRRRDAFSWGCLTACLAASTALCQRVLNIKAQ